MHSILITGSASGIGAGVASELARAGRHVIFSDLKLADVEAVAAQARSQGGSAEALALDVTSDESVKQALAPRGRPGQKRGLATRGTARAVPDRALGLPDPGDAHGRGAAHARGAAADAGTPLWSRRERGQHPLAGGQPVQERLRGRQHGLVGFAKAIALETADTDITINTI
jgi:3-hydroxybutyrate dehydrogenase